MDSEVSQYPFEKSIIDLNITNRIISISILDNCLVMGTDDGYLYSFEIS